MKDSIRWFVGAALLAVFCGAAAAVEIGSVAPDFSRADLAGGQMRLADHRGKLVLLNFWATWCPPCRKEMPLFSRWQREYGAQGLQIIGISMDDDISLVREVLAQRPVQYPIAIGDAKLGELYGGVLGLPLSFLIDSRGRIVARYQGESDLAAMETDLKALLSRHRQ